MDFKFVSFDDTHFEFIYGIRTGLSKKYTPISNINDIQNILNLNPISLGTWFMCNSTNSLKSDWPIRWVIKRISSVWPRQGGKHFGFWNWRNSPSWSHDWCAWTGRIFRLREFFYFLKFLNFWCQNSSKLSQETIRKFQIGFIINSAV